MAGNTDDANKAIRRAEQAQRDEDEEVKQEARDRVMARRAVALRAEEARVGWTPLGGTSRRWRDPKGKVVSYRTFFERTTGRSLEEAVRERHPEIAPELARRGKSGKFDAETRTASQIRQAARDGKLSADEILTHQQERALASKGLRQMLKGHYLSEATKAGVSGEEPERRTLYGRLVAMLQKSTVPKPKEREYMAPESATRKEKLQARDAYRKARDAWEEENGPYSKKADLLRAMGRKTDFEYAVGETPD